MRCALRKMSSGALETFDTHCWRRDNKHADQRGRVFFFVSSCVVRKRSFSPNGGAGLPCVKIGADASYAFFYLRAGLEFYFEKHPEKDCFRRQSSLVFCAHATQRPTRLTLLCTPTLYMLASSARRAKA